VWWHTLIIPALRRLRQEDLKFKTIMRLYLKNAKQKQNPQETNKKGKSHHWTDQR
jgi:hypothetical protein